jgi:hypothetical protein
MAILPWSGYDRNAAGSAFETVVPVISVDRGAVTAGFAVPDDVPMELAAAAVRDCCCHWMAENGTATSF